MESFKNNLKNFCFKKKDYLIVFGLIFVFMSALFIAFGLFPFGSNTVAHYDLFEQVEPLINLIYDFFSGKASFSFSFFIGGGANTFGYLSYYILSPFSFLFFVLGRANLIYTVNIILFAKLLVIGIVFCYFLNKTFKLNTLNTVLLSLLYTFSGYMLFSYTWITWLDLLIYVPLLALSFNHLIKTGKIAWFVTFLTAIILNCFALGSFTLVLLFGLFTAYAVLVLKQKERKTALVKVSISYAISLCVSAIILVPSLMQFINSGRNSYGLETIFFGETFSNLPSKLTTILADFILIFFTVLFVIKANKKKPLNQFLIIALIVTLLPAIFDEINLMLNLGSYYGYCLRFGFLNLFFESVATAFILKRAEEKEVDFKIEKSKDELKHRATDLSFLILVVLAVILLITIFLFKNLSDALSNAQSTITIFSIYGFFAILFGLVLFAVFKSRKTGSVSKRFVLIVLPILVFAQIAINGSVFIGGGSSNYQDLTRLSQTISTINFDEYARFKDYSQTIGANQTLNLGVNTFTAFSSLTDKNLADIGIDLGYSSTKNYTSSFGGTALSDALANYGYYVSVEPLDRPYLTLVANDNGYYIYKNEWVFPTAFTVDDINLNITDTDDLFDVQNKLFNALGGSENLIDEMNLFSQTDNLEIVGTNLTFANENNDYIFNLTDPTQSGELIFTYTADVNTVLYMILSYDTNYSFNFSQSLNGTDYSTQMTLPFIQDLGYVESGNTIEFKITTSTGLIINNLKFATMNLQKMNDLVSDVNSRAVDVIYGKSTISAEVNNVTDSPYLFISNTYLNGWVNNSSLQNETVERAYMGFIAVGLNYGTNNILLSYNNPYLMYGVYAGIVGLILTLLLIGINILIKKSKPLKLTLYYLSVGLGVIITIVFFTFPCVMVVVKLFGII